MGLLYGFAQRNGAQGWHRWYLRITCNAGCRHSSKPSCLISGATSPALHVPSSLQARKCLPFCFTTTNFGFHRSNYDCYYCYSYNYLLLSFFYVLNVVIIIIVIITNIIIIIVVIIVVLPQVTRRSNLYNVYTSVAHAPSVLCS